MLDWRDERARLVGWPVVEALAGDLGRREEVGEPEAFLQGSKSTDSEWANSKVDLEVNASLMVKRGGETLRGRIHCKKKLDKTRGPQSPISYDAGL